MSVFDFRDGTGPVPACRHTNPDGTRGAWVYGTARVSGNGDLVWIDRIAHGISVTVARDGAGATVQAGCTTFHSISEALTHAVEGPDEWLCATDEQRARWLAEVSTFAELAQIRFGLTTSTEASS